MKKKDILFLIAINIIFWFTMLSFEKHSLLINIGENYFLIDYVIFAILFSILSTTILYFFKKFFLKRRKFK